VSQNYVNPEATRTADLGPCRCPVDPAPHERDSAEVVVRFGYGDKGKIWQTRRAAGLEAAHQVMVLLGVRSWTLVRPDGSARPINPEEVARLDELTIIGRSGPDPGQPLAKGLVDYLDEAMEPEDPLPNPSGAPSPDGPSESASPTQTIQAQPSSTST
jgi:hypothetical protein